MPSSHKDTIVSQLPVIVEAAIVAVLGADAIVAVLEAAGAIIAHEADESLFAAVKTKVRASLHGKLFLSSTWIV